MQKVNKGYFLLVLIVLSFNACIKKTVEVNNTVKVNISSYPESLHPYYHQSNVAIHIMKHVYQPLIDVDYQTDELIPVLAESRPEIVYLENGQVEYQFKIRDNALWSDGKPVVASDVEFSWKLMKLPGRKKNVMRDQYFELFDAFELDPSNNKKFKMRTSGVYVQGEMAFSDMFILPKHIYDPKKYTNTLKLSDIISGNLTGDQLNEIDDYLKDFEKMVYDTNQRLVNGSGPYLFSTLTNENTVVLERNPRWWGANETNKNLFFENKVEQIHYKVSRDMGNVIAELMLEESDLSTIIPISDLNNLEKSQVFSDQFTLHTPTKFSFTYLGLNLDHSILKDRSIREAIALSIDKDGLLDDLLGGFGEKVVSSFHPTSKSYNHDIEDYEFNISKALKILDDNGWKDRDGDGVRQKIVNGREVDLMLRLSYPKNYMGGRIAEYMQESYKGIGLRLELHELTFDSYLKLNKKQDFDMFLGSFLTFSNMIDPKQLWHSSSHENGVNWVGYASDDVDELIDQIRTEKNESKRIVFEKELQQIVHDDIPFVFLFAPQHKIIISNKIKKPLISSSGLGFWESSFEKE